ncbi:rRNA maturation RNase YbeY [Aquisphaera insulae]|uniref:rRNA maturation RNase YbeY n=1 Tax=Aquisphaera insulae TaxID=2712864 RepID=UPI0013EE2943|nr:rRNA maturation RNase YbeY [Aquisphaera insulae]
MPSPPARSSPDPARRIARTESIDVDISNTQRFLGVDAGRLAELARAVLRGEGVSEASISIALVDDATIHRINRQHLDHDWPTDVISFVLSEPADPGLVGELVISAEMARSTAAELSEDPDSELELYVVHGLLHLCGYDDTSDGPAAAMRERQRDILERHGLAGSRRGLAS